MQEFVNCSHSISLQHLNNTFMIINSSDDDIQSTSFKSIRTAVKKLNLRAILTVTIATSKE